jgi:DNA-binding transcriptional regulator YhcF (GntR family)
MNIDENSMIPIYVQIANSIEDDILSGKLKEGNACYSQLVLAKELRVNPATAAKGINLLVTRGILIKKRGQAMTISMNAREMISVRKRREEMVNIADELVHLGKKISMSIEELTGFVEERYQTNSLQENNSTAEGEEK